MLFTSRSAARSRCASRLRVFLPGVRMALEPVRQHGAVCRSRRRTDRARAAGEAVAGVEVARHRNRDAVVLIPTGVAVIRRCVACAVAVAVAVRIAGRAVRIVVRAAGVIAATVSVIIRIVRSTERRGCDCARGADGGRGNRACRADCAADSASFLRNGLTRRSVFSPRNSPMPMWSVSPSRPNRCGP